MKRHLKIISLLVLTALISLTLILGGDFTLSFTNQEHNARQPKVVRILDNVSNQLIEVPLTPEIKTKNARLKELSKDVVKILPKLDPSGFFFAGMYADVFTGTLYVGFTELRTSLTEPLKYMPREAKDIRLEFFHAKFSLTELRSLEIKLQESFIEGFTKKEAEILSDADDIILREKLRKEFEEKVRERNEKRVVEIPINLTGVNVQNNGLIIGLSVIKPQYIKAIRQVIGEEVPIEFLEGDFETDNMRHSRIRPLVGGIKIGDSTLGFRAIDRNRVLGFVMTGHAGWEGATVWQPAHSWWQDNRVGTIAINPHLINVRHSDAAFVRLNPGVNIRASIWGLGDIVEWRYSNLTPPGIIVLMDGMMSGTTAGVIHSRGISIQMGIESPFGWVHNQVLAAYSSQGGDSGGPVSSLEDPLLPFQVVLYGIHVGMRRSDNLRIYSPVAGIERDLGVHWGGLGW